MMSKSNYFSSKSVFGQLISLTDDKKIKDAVKKTDSDRYVKRFKSKDTRINQMVTPTQSLLKAIDKPRLWYPRKA
jgi:hypothetical protein